MDRDRGCVYSMHTLPRCHGSYVILLSMWASLQCISDSRLAFAWTRFSGDTHGPRGGQVCTRMMGTVSSKDLGHTLCF